MNATLSLGSHDLQLKTEVAPQVRILTSWMAVDRRYVSDVIAPAAVLQAMTALHLPAESWYATKDEAIAGHHQAVTRIGMLLQRTKAQTSPPRTRAKRLCMPCDELVTGNPCPKCGADTEPWPAGETL